MAAWGTGVKPAPFDYYGPEVLDDALAIRAKLGTNAAPLAGGQTLVAQLSRRELRPRALIDLNSIAALARYRLDGGTLTLGAMVRQATALDDERLSGSWSGLRDAIGCMGFPATRTRGTVGGALVAAIATGQLTLIAHLFDAAFQLRSVGGARTLRCGRFFADGRATVGDDELLTAVCLEGSETTSSAYCECRPYTGGPVLAAAAVALPAGHGGPPRPARLFVSGVDALPRRLPRTEETLRHARFPHDLDPVMNALTTDLAECNGRLSRVRVGQVRAVVRRAWCRATERTASIDAHVAVGVPNHNGRM
jgi:CO/xanthine dehydrogenase FAD-binding subunit